MQINEVVQKVDLSKRAVKYYEEQGLLTVEKDTNGYRNYSEDNIVTLKKISVYRKLGIGIKDIKKLQDGNNKEILENIYRDKERELEKQNEELNALRIFIQQGDVEPASRLPVALRSSASAKLYQKWSKTPELRGFRGFSFSNGLTQFDRTKPLLTRFLWVKWWTTTPKRGLMG